MSLNENAQPRQEGGAGQLRVHASSMAVDAHLLCAAYSLGAVPLAENVCVHEAAHQEGAEGGPNSFVSKYSCSSNRTDHILSMSMSVTTHALAASARLADP
jgi:hypothetical protein